MPRYLAELYLATVGPGDLEEAAARARTAAEEMSRGGTPVSYLRSIFVPGDETWFLLYEAPSAADVVEAGARAGIPVERVVDAVVADRGEP
jgi:hypothetical protein